MENTIEKLKEMGAVVQVELLPVDRKEVARALENSAGVVCDTPGQREAVEKVVKRLRQQK